MSDGTRILAQLRDDEIKVIQLMRLETSPDADFVIKRRDGKIVTMNKTTVHAKEFTNDRLQEPIR